MHRVLGRLAATLSVITLALTLTSAASASTVPLASATGSNFFSWCSQSTLNSLLPDAAPPATPSSCSDYTGSQATLTAQFSSTAGRLTVSEYIADQGVPGTVVLKVNGTQVGAAITIPNNTTGWLTFPATTVGLSDAVTVVTATGWYQATGNLKAYGVHGDVLPWSSPAWSAFGAPGSWATTPVPGNITTQSGNGPFGKPLATEVPAEIAGQAAAQSWPDFTAYNEQTYYQPLNTTLQPVRLCEWGNTCVPNNGAATDDLWRAAMGLPNNAVPNRTTGACSSNCTSLGGGLPITAAVTPAPGTDRAAVLCLGGGDSFQPPWTLTNADGTPFVRPDGQQIEGNCWEVWGLRADPSYDPSQPVSASNTQWMIAWGAHRTGFITQTGTPTTTYGYTLDTLSGKYCPKAAAGEWRCGGLTDAIAQTWFGPDVLTPGAADSTTYDDGWGVTAAELPLLTDVIQQHDCQSVLNGATSDFGHALGIQLQYTRVVGYGYAGAYWPAGNSDGNNQSVAPVEGMRLYWPASIQPPAGANAATLAVFRTIQKYGLVIDDQTGGGPAITYNTDGSYKAGGALDVRYELAASGATNECSTLGWPDLASLPWTQLTLIAQGADWNANPTG